jgi:hypothetical protein
VTAADVGRRCLIVRIDPDEGTVRTGTGEFREHPDYRVVAWDLTLDQPAQNRTVYLNATRFANTQWDELRVATRHMARKIEAVRSAIDQVMGVAGWVREAESAGGGGR